jgi:putative NADH-flavin reductase
MVFAGEILLKEEIMNNSSIAILGANGRAGSAILDTCLQSGFKVKALFRDAQKCPQLNSGSLTKLVGDATEKSVLEAVISGCDVVINATSNKANPGPISCKVTRLILEIIQNQPGLRYFVVTGKTIKGPNDTFSLTTFLERKVMEKAFSEIMKSKNEELQALYDSDSAWTLIRCPLIVDKEPKGYVASLSKCPGREVSRRNIAAFIIEELAKKEYLRQPVFVYDR